MRYLHGPLPVLGGLLAARALAADEVVHVTDIDVFPLLPPCVTGALSWVIDVQTMDNCENQDDVTSLQSCICSNSAVSEQVLSSLSNSISYSCGESATADQETASRVFGKYCDPASTLTIPTPTENIVNAYITDLAEMQYLPSCAYDGLSYAVMAEASSRCPEAASLYAPCVCGKSDLVEDVQATITSSVKYSCENNEDVTLAANFYTEYCNMNNGTTSFATPDGPPGDMTYHITALTEYRLLDSCAQSGVSEAVVDQTSYMCAAGPQALASCVCIKSGMWADVSSTLTSLVKLSCDSTATNQLSSAMDVLQYYCSAAKAELTATVGESISETYPTDNGGTNAGSNSANPTETGAGGGGGNGDGGGGGGENGGGVTRTAAIAGGVAGGVALIALIAAIAIIVRRRKNKAKDEAAATAAAGASPDTKPPIQHEYHGTPELVGNNHGDLKPASVSPAASSGMYAPPHSELPAQNTYRSEVHGDEQFRGHAVPYGQQQQQQYHQQQHQQHQHYQQHPHHQQPQELSSPGYGYYPAHLRGQPIQEVHGTWSPVSPSPNPGWQSGPVESYEMDANFGRRHQ